MTTTKPLRGLPDMADAEDAQHMTHPRNPGHPPLPMTDPRCGTDAGYHAHRRAHAPACPGCRAAHAATARAARQRHPAKTTEPEPDPGNYVSSSRPTPCHGITETLTRALKTLGRLI